MGVPPPPRKIRVAVDLTLAVLSVALMLTATPVGGLLRMTSRRLFGWPARERTLASYFSTGRGDALTHRTALALSEAPRPGSESFAEATRAGVEPRLARAVLVVVSEGRLTPDGDADPVLDGVARRALQVAGVVPPENVAAASVRRAAVLEAVARLTARFGSEEAAVAALGAGVERVAFALARARAAGVSDAEHFEGFGAFLGRVDRRRAARLVHGSFALRTAYGLVAPIAVRHRVTSPFGWRVHPVLGTRKRHTGIDVAVPTGTPLRASAAGEVMVAAEDSVNGRFVKIDHGHGLVTAYCHASRLDVTRGDRVAAGATIALSGATGRATGPHLHYQVELGGRPVDPLLFLRGLSGAEAFAPSSEGAVGSGAGDGRPPGVAPKRADPLDAAVEALDGTD